MVPYMCTLTVHFTHTRTNMLCVQLCVLLTIHEIAGMKFRVILYAGGHDELSVAGALRFRLPASKQRACDRFRDAGEARPTEGAVDGHPGTLLESQRHCYSLLLMLSDVRVLHCRGSVRRRRGVPHASWLSECECDCAQTRTIGTRCGRAASACCKRVSCVSRHAFP